MKYNRDILPILAENCLSCHGFDAKARQGGLRLDTRAGAISAAESGLKAIHPGHPSQSELIRRITSRDDSEVMPPPKSGRKLTSAQREVLRRWIHEGASYEKHWAFIAPRYSIPPAAGNESHPIDQFVFARLANEKVKPSAEAAPATLIRRVSLDLIGLPPTPAEIDAFLANWALDPQRAYLQLVDELLASPHYGERWGRWWLDQARYADSNGYSIDSPREMWPYRDWVVRSLNRDIPFDQFTIEQLAGDLLPAATQDQKIATGFHRNTQINEEGGIDKEQFRIDSVFDRVATTGVVWLGLSIGCAQCHDHKYDPIEQREYYQLFAFLNNQDEPKLKIFSDDVNVAELKEEWKEAERQLDDFMLERPDAIEQWSANLVEAVRKRLSAEAVKALETKPSNRTFAQRRVLFATGPGNGNEEFRSRNERYLDLNRRLNEGTTTLVMSERAQIRKTNLLVKGDFTRPAGEVVPGTPAILPGLANSSGKPTQNRLDLAQWLMSPQNPLTARVIVNRIWLHYFGRGLVETENDFGLQGTPPTHPELLDWLAISLQQQGWSLKQLHRLIVTSQTYRQSSVERADLRERDPLNLLLARQRRLRLEAEIVRDTLLVASGKFGDRMAGPPVFPPIPDGVMGQGQVKRKWYVSAGENRYRRGLYTFIYRATPPPAMNVFDSPDGYNTCTRRIRSNTPLQALTLMNDSAFVELAKSLQGIIELKGLEYAFQSCTSRKAEPAELAVLNQLDSFSAARTLLNLDETISRE